MARRLRVKLNVPLLAENLSKEDSQVTSESEVREWLQDAGFTPHGDWWLVTEADLGQVDPSEVLEIAPEDDPGVGDA
jgi:hypothetical protein